MLYSFIATFVTMIALDAFWLTLNLQSHTKLFESVQQAPLKIRLIPSLLIYILMPAAATYFAINPAKTINEASTRGATLGLSMYGLYDLTNYATLKGWTETMVLKDVLWGTTLTGVASAVGFYFRK